MISLVIVAAGHIGNEYRKGLSSSAGTRKEGRSRPYVFGLWGAIALIGAVAKIRSRRMKA